MFLYLGGSASPELKFLVTHPGRLGGSGGGSAQIYMEGSKPTPVWRRRITLIIINPSICNNSNEFSMQASAEDCPLWQPVLQVSTSRNLKMSLLRYSRTELKVVCLLS